MLATVNAAEALFRHDAGTRAREMAILSSMRDRRQAMAQPEKPRMVRRPMVWARPIGVSRELSAAPVCV